MKWLFLPVTLPAFLAGLLISVTIATVFYFLIGFVLAKDAVVWAFWQGMGDK